MTTPGDLNPISGTSLNTPQNVFLEVEDKNTVPSNSARIALNQISGGAGSYAPTKLAPVAPTTLTGSESYGILVDSVSPSNVVTVPSVMECEITNTTQTGANLVIATTGNSNTTLSPGQSLVVNWDGSQHDLTTQSAGGVTVDAGMSDSSANPVQNQIVKGYIDFKTQVDNAMDDASTLPVQNAVIKAYVDNMVGGVGGVIDSAMSDSSVNAVQNQVVKAYVDNSSLVRPGDEVVTASGNAATDTTAFNTAVAVLNAAGKGTLWIDAEETPLKLNTTSPFTAAISFRGLTSNTTIELQAATVSFSYSPGGQTNWDPINHGAGVAFSTPTAGDNIITSSNLSFAEGDHAIMWGDNALTGLTPNLTANMPMEIHQIKDSLGSNKYALASKLADSMTTNPRIVKAPMMLQPGQNQSNVIISDLTFSLSSPAVQDEVLFDIRCLNGVNLERIRYELSATSGGPGWIMFNFCTNVIVDGMVIDGSDDYGDTGNSRYVLEFGTVNGAVVANSLFKRCRHAVDTLAAVTVSNNRYGGPLNLIVIGNVFYSAGDPVEQQVLAPVSTHGEGYGVFVIGNTFDIGDWGGVGGISGGANYAVNARSRHLVFANNQLKGSGAVKGIFARANDITITGNVFDGFWVSIHVWDFENCIISGNTFRNGTGTGSGQIIAASSTNSLIRGNTFFNNENPALYGATLTKTTDVLFTHNLVHSTPTSSSLATLSFTGTGAYSTTGTRVTHNTFVDCVGQVLHDDGTGTGLIFSHNVINGYTATTLIDLAGGSGHRFTFNEAHKGSNTNFLALGTLTDAQIKLFGNVLDGYASNMGLTGTNAATISASQGSNNYT